MRPQNNSSIYMYHRWVTSTTVFLFFFCSLSAALLFHTTLTIVIRLLHGLTNRDYVFAQVHDKLIVLIARASQYPIDQWNEIRHRRMSSVHYGHVGRLIAFAHSIIAHTVLSSLRVSLNQSSFSKLSHFDPETVKWSWTLSMYLSPHYWPGIY